MLQNLGGWLKCQLKKGVKEQGEATEKLLDDSLISVADLHEQWAEQCEAQLSIRTYAPARLKKELDTVLGLQAELDASNHALQTTWAAIAKDHNADLTLDALNSME
ncbi:hypothetical protein J3R82DRAFT_175 [Butyriboletus roseoflavus]|nr:hypothetical protein J3R82DRAFT_175 [Butyriboletus roseoflavus]